MFTRTATASDLPDIADIASKCFMDDELFSFITPYRHKFPLDFRNSFLRRLRTRFWTPGFTINVAVLEAGDKTAEGEGRRDEGQAEGKIVGCAVWDRIGEDDAAQRWKNKGWTGCKSSISPPFPELDIKRGSKQAADIRPPRWGYEQQLKPSFSPSKLAMFRRCT